MGGYCGKAVAVLYKDIGCFDVYVWHDGEFPFGDESPTRLHHCDPGQFVRFGEEIIKLQNSID